MNNLEFRVPKDEKEFNSMGLIKTAGSDFHKPGKNSYLGKNNLSEDEFIKFYSNAKKILKGKIKWNL